MLAYYKIHGISVGANSSCAPPIYRPSVPIHTITYILLKIIINMYVNTKEKLNFEHNNITEADQPACVQHATTLRVYHRALSSH